METDMPGPLLIFPAAAVAGLGVWFWRTLRVSRRPRDDSREDLIALLTRRLERRGQATEWEIFLAAPQMKSAREVLRRDCLTVESDFASPDSHRFYTEEGEKKLRTLIQTLRGQA